MTIDIKHTHEQCKSFHENNPACAAGKHPEGYTLVGDCNLFEKKLTIRYTKGRCHHCNLAFQWPRKKGWELKNMTCPVCGLGLRQTTRMLKSVPWLFWNGARWVLMVGALYEDGTVPDPVDYTRDYSLTRPTL